MIGEWIGNYSPPPLLLPICPHLDSLHNHFGSEATADTWWYFLRLSLQLIVHRDYRLVRLDASTAIAISILLINGVHQWKIQIPCSVEREFSQYVFREARGKLWHIVSLRIQVCNKYFNFFWYDFNGIIKKFF